MAISLIVVRILLRYFNMNLNTVHPRSSKGGLNFSHESRLYTLGYTKILSTAIRKFYFRCKNPLCHGRLQCDDNGVEGV